MIGQTISHYRILEKLGEGGMGIVYKAHDTKLERDVALKFLPTHLSASEQDKARFIQEAKAASALNHPNVCTIYRIDEFEGQQFIEMEYVDGVTLRKKVDESPLKVSDAVSFAVQIGEALQEAHSKGIVHRDIKADNIMVNSKNQIKVMDFGLAKLKGAMKLTRTSSTVGTLAYMAPEQIQGGQVDSRSDIFSFGVVLYEMLARKTPFRGEHEAAMVYSIVNEEPDPVQKHCPEISPEFIHILSTALEKDPEDRYQAVSEMVRDLRRVQRQSSKVSRKFGTEALLGQKDIREQQSISPEAKSEPQVSSPEVLGGRARWWKNKRIMAGASVLAGLALFYGLYQFLWKPGPDRGSVPSFQLMKITQLTSNGKTVAAAISPDGKYLVHVMREAGQQSAWVKRIATGSNVQIIPPAKVEYIGLTISFDGEYVYYVVREEGKLLLFRIPILGGTSRKLLEDVQSAITLSPNSKQIAFARYYPKTGDFSVMVANEDGTAERILASHRGNLWFEYRPAWSPDGKIVVSALGSWAGGMHYSVVAISEQGGKEIPIGTQKWAELSGLEWLRDASGLVMTASEQRGSPDQVWFLSYPEGVARRITNDLNDYTSLSVTSDGRMLSSVQYAVRSNVWIVPGADASKAVQITSGRDEGRAGVSVTPDGKIVYAATTGGNTDLWIVNQDGSNQGQLTSDPSPDYSPSVSPDNRSIVFVSDRSGIPNLWKIAIDGSRPQQLTSGGEDYNPDISPDGKWVAFRSWDAGPLMSMKVSIDGGDPTPIVEKSTSRPTFSPDGKQVAYLVFGGLLSSSRRFEVVDLENGSIVKSMPLPATASLGWSYPIRWTLDGRAITYIDTREGISNIWSQPLSGGLPKQLTTFKTGLIYNFAWSRDGKTLVVSRGDVTNDAVLISDFR